MVKDRYRWSKHGQRQGPLVNDMVKDKYLDCKLRARRQLLEAKDAQPVAAVYLVIVCWVCKRQWQHTLQKHHQRHQQQGNSSVLGE